MTGKRNRFIPMAAALWIALALTGCRMPGAGAGAGAEEPRVTTEQEIPAAEQPTPGEIDADPEPTWRIERPAPPTVDVETRPLPVPAGPTLVRQGQPPLVYMVEAPATVSVVNLRTEQRLASASVGKGTIIRIEPRSGIIFGDERMTPGPLPADHTYGIYIESDQPSEIRNEMLGPQRRAQ